MYGLHYNTRVVLNIYSNDITDIGANALANFILFL
jgi:hypothetical protein